jgi:nucleotide-binding universal stress UspA family protein
LAGLIVCGVDDSRGGREALIAAAALSDRLQLGLIAVHAAPAGVDWAQRMRAAEVLETIAVSGGRADRAERRTEVGRPALRLAAVATEENAGFVVVGSRGRGRVSAAVLGSVSRDLVMHAPCPVLVVPQGASFLPAQPAGSTSVVCGVDGSKLARRAARHAADLARRLSARLVLTHVYRPRRSPRAPGPARRAAHRLLDEALLALPPGTDAELRLERGDTAEQLRRVARDEHAEVVAVGSRARGHLPTLLSGSVGGDLGVSAPAPVLIVGHGGWEEIAHAGPAHSDAELKSLAGR